MSTGVSDQRRGQGNGKDNNEHEDFSSWRNQSIQSTYVAPADPYFSSYYGAYDHHGAWSSYPQQESYGLDFGFSNFSGQQQYEYWERKADYYQVEQGMQNLALDKGDQQSAPKKLTWASIASQPAKPVLPSKKKSMVPPPMVTPRTPLDIGTWEVKNGVAPPPPTPPAKAPPPVVRKAVTPPPVEAPPTPIPVNVNNPVLEELQSKHIYNPKEFDLSAKNARFFVIKSYSEDDIHRSIKYEIWCSTEHGNKRLDAAFRERDGKGPVYLLFSVNGSGHFCGMAEMISPVDMSSSLSVWSQDKWRGQFTVKWIYVKDVPNSALRHIRLENNENKPVTNSRDTQEVPAEKGLQVLKIIHTYRHATSIFDDFSHYEKKQAEEDQRKTVKSPTNEQQEERPREVKREPREREQPREQRDQREPREQRDQPREQRDQPREQRDQREPREQRDQREPREQRDQREPREQRDQREPRDQREYNRPPPDRQDRGYDRDYRPRNDRDRDRGSYDYRDRDGYNRERDGRGFREGVSSGYRPSSDRMREREIFRGGDRGGDRGGRRPRRD